MIQKKIYKKNLQVLIDKVIKDNRFFGPVLDENNSVSLSEIKNSKDLVFEYSNFKLPPKRMIRPWSEKLFKIDKKEIRSIPHKEQKIILFGIRPCDAVSMTHLDKVFLQGSYIDDFYSKRRNNTTIITLACSIPENTCFCTSLNGGPANTKGSDIIVFNLDDMLLIESCSSKGEKFLEEYKSYFMEIAEEDLGKKQRIYPDVESINIEIPANEKLKENFNSQAWDKISKTCLGCNVCTFLCPTCHCFTISDEIKELRGYRLRIDDSCLQEGFTNEASGHNPRLSGMERMRQRIMHKFSYAVDIYKERFCVGCGRCIKNCPVNIDIRESLVKVVK